MLVAEAETGPWTLETLKGQLMIGETWTTLVEITDQKEGLLEDLSGKLLKIDSQQEDNTDWM